MTPHDRRVAIEVAAIKRAARVKEIMRDATEAAKRPPPLARLPHGRIDRAARLREGLRWRLKGCPPGSGSA